MQQTDRSVIKHLAPPDVVLFLTDACSQPLQRNCLYTVKLHWKLAVNMLQARRALNDLLNMSMRIL